MLENTYEIVISGISLKLPESDNIEEFAQHLFNGIDLVTNDEAERRWSPGLYGLPTRSGKLKSLDKFDAEFFGISETEANVMDPMQRLLLECTFEAIFDAGVNPSTIHGSKTGVFIGACKSESSELLLADPDSVSEFNATGHSRGLFANNISYHFGLTGPSLTTETACSSSLIALERAVLAIRTGQCDGAIVGGANLLLKPQASLEFHRLGMLSADGKCKAFDKSANGYVRSEAIVVIYIQKTQPNESTFLKSYGTILNIKSNSDGYKEQGVTYPSGSMQFQLLQEVYAEINLDPSLVDYVEAHGTGTSIGDPQEVNAIAAHFCGSTSRPRAKPLLIGSVKSNMGHSEHASGLCSLAKVIIAIVSGEIPPNLHFREPNENIPGLIDGRLKVVAGKTHLNIDSIIGINSFGFGGSNVHLVVRANPSLNQQPQKHQDLQNLFPVIVPFSGRAESSIMTSAEKIRGLALDLAPFLHNVHKHDIPGHDYRGFLVQSRKAKTGEICIQRKLVASDEPEVWLVFSGMGSQWAGMGRDLLNVPAFKKSIDQCSLILAPYNIDLINLLINSEDQVLESTLHSFVAVAAVQIALMDVLASIGINSPAGILGHSIGENVCAYADGCTTKTQTLLVSYWAGLIFQEEQHQLQPGSMATIGLGWDETKARCPPTIHLACHNSNDNVSVAGRVAEIKQLVRELSEEGIFAREIHAGQAFHSPYIGILEKKLEDALHGHKVLENSKPRSNKWISTSFHEAYWSSEIASFASPSYFAHNVVSPVLFKQALEKIPPNSVVIEVGPHCLLQPILKRALDPTKRNITIVGLSSKTAPNNTEHLLTSLGKIWASGVEVDFTTLCENSRPCERLPYLSPLVSWNHEQSFKVVNFEQNSKSNHQNSIKISLETHSYLGGYKLHDQVVFPNVGFLPLVWKAFAEGKQREFQNFPVILENVQFSTLIPLAKEQKNSTIFSINILEGNGKFEVSHQGIVVAYGQIREAKLDDEPKFKPITADGNAKDDPAWEILSSNEIYTKFGKSGYNVDGLFQNLESVNLQGKSAQTSWKKNWISYLESLIQFEILSQQSPEELLPFNLSSIQYIYLDPCQFSLNTGQISEDERELLTCTRLQNQKGLIAPGVEASGLEFELVLEEFSSRAPKMCTVEMKSEENEGHLRTDAQLNSADAIMCRAEYVLAQCLKGKSKFIARSFAGFNSSGERVMALVLHQSVTDTGISRNIPVDPKLVWKIPSIWSMEDAALIPYAYAITYYALIIKAELKPTDSVLIPFDEKNQLVGCAALSIASAKQCLVYATVSSVEDKEFLLSTFPSMNQEQIMILNSKGLGFTHQILETTKGLGVNVVLNCEMDALQESLQCLKQHGTFLHAHHGGPSLKDNFIGMACFLKNITFHGIHLCGGTGGPVDQLSSISKVEIYKFILCGIHDGSIRPIRTRIPLRLMDSTVAIANSGNNWQYSILKL